MEKFVLNTYQTLLSEIENISDLKNLTVKNPGHVSDAVKSAISRLKLHFRKHPFNDRDAEIVFFKYQKPKFYCEYIYALEIFTVESNKPHAEQTLVRNYYEQELRFIKRFFDQYRFLYQYYLVDGIEMDQVYFVRGQEFTDIVLPVAPDADPEFSTSGDFLFAKFLAYERVQGYIMDRLYPPGVKEKSKLSLNWTGDKMNLIEIAYGIYDTAQINQGGVDIKDIISWLEESLNISLQRHYRLFSEMKNRKSVSPTRYLDHMGDMVKQHLTEGEAFRPQAPKPVSGSKSGQKKLNK